MRLSAVKHIAVLLAALLCIPLTAGAQQEEGTVVRSNDTLNYTYVPCPEVVPEPAADSVAERPGFFRRVVNYFDSANEDHTFEKKLDISFIGGPSYSSTEKLGLGVMAAGLYRTDRTDSVTSPSNVSLFAAASTSGFYTVGIRGMHIFRHDRNRISYKLAFASHPNDFWGIGYMAGAYNEASSFVEKKSSFEMRYLHQTAENFYLGAQLDFKYVKGVDFTNEAYLEGMKHSYLATGIGLLAEYDSRDFEPNPARGLYLSLSGLYYPKGLGNCDEGLWEVGFAASTYQQLWRTGLLALELRGEFHSYHTPWPLMARMGGDARMRGYYEGRYTDLDMMVAQVELRQRIWRRIGCVVWVGAGNVFPDFRRFVWSQTLPNYGVGLRWEFKNRVNVRFDFGFGRKTSGAAFQINEAF